MIKQCNGCGHTYGSQFSRHVKQAHHWGAQALEYGQYPATPFFGDPKGDSDLHVVHVKSDQPRKQHYVREKLASLMQQKFLVPRKYWLMASQAVYVHECLTGKKLPKPRKPMPEDQVYEVEALLRKSEAELPPYDGEVVVEPSASCNCHALKVDFATQTDAPKKEVMKSEQGMQTERLDGGMVRDGVLVAEGRKEPIGVVKAVPLRSESVDNWQYPNFLHVAYGPRVAISFAVAMGVD